jgi:D-beta-D-heptose 7-phosphate kinase/D-beta-D-heptose 1-phosphate adenosyltransferase
MSLSRKFKTLPALKKALAREKKARRRVVFTNGCFDILHIGHLRYLTQAKKLGHVLVIGLNSDSSVKKLKGPSRPLTPQKERAEILAGLEAVDYVTVFSEPTPEKLIHAIIPDVLVKGGDWKKKDIVGSDFVEANGGKVYSLPYVKDRSTTGLIARIRKAL